MKAFAQAACAPPWQAGMAVSVGQMASFPLSGTQHNWTALQVETQAAPDWQPPNVPALWSDAGVCAGTGGGGSCTVKPGAPTGLTASGVTQSGVTLSWTAPSAPSGCSLTGFTILQNGAAIGTTASTSFNVTGLAASTSFTFTVEASDAAGLSVPSTSVAVTTQAGTGGTGGGTCAAAWSAATTYHAGDTASLDGTNYRANFFTQNQSPATNNGGAGTGQPWTSTGSCSFCTTIAAAPGKPTASGTTFNSTQLTWPAVTPPANCSITGYTVLKNGSPVGTATGTSFTVSGLTAQSTFNFTVKANDGAGASAASPAVSVTTPACSGSQCNAAAVTFAAYKDVTLSADFNTGLQRSAVTGTVQPVTAAMPNQTLIWSFATGTCDQETWAGISPAMEAINVQAFVNAGKKYILSTGGAAGSFDCASGQGLINFINRYNSPNLVGIDYDIELGQSQQVIDNLINATKAAMQAFPNLRFTFTIQSFGTLAANPITGASAGTTVVREINRLGLTGNFAINLLTFDYGATTPSTCVVVNGACDMAQSAIQAAQALNQQSGIPFSHIGVTMMIGRADTQDEITTLQDIDTVNAFVLANGMPVSFFWAFDRDNPGPGGSSSNGNGAATLSYTREYMSSLHTP
ncbi:MAG TPA: fibronectin type III domain-containing protein [Kofleriaceae bacterium]|nr:fibronectin type III domain-containing protein [Kofleriaceae bacterium]